jgi:hypothetical protein
LSIGIEVWHRPGHAGSSSACIHWNAESWFQIFGLRISCQPQM